MGRDSRSARLDITPVGGIDLVHLGKVVHAGEEDVDLDNLVNAGASGLEDGSEVLDALMLAKRLASNSRVPRGEGSSTTYGVSLNVAVDQLASLSVHGNSAGDEDHAIGLDGLAVDTRKGLGSLVGEDCDLVGRHCDGLG